MEPSDLGLLIPDFRDRQLETIQAIANSPKRITLVEGPPGSGKSAIAIGSSRYMGGKKTAVLTNTLQLQEQYVEDRKLPGLVAVRGRKNFPCAIQAGTAADEAPCTVCGPRECPEYYGKCQYYKQLRDGLAAPISVHNYCLAPGTRVLTSDLRWVRIDSIAVGDELVGFDEELGLSARHKPTTVEAVSEQDLECYRIETDQGSVVASLGHRWVISKSGPANGSKAKSGSRKPPKGCDRCWVETKDLRPGDQISRFSSVWVDDNSPERHYLAGFFDGEGSATRVCVSFAQNSGLVLDHVLDLLMAKDFDPVIFWKGVSHSTCKHYRLKGGRESIRFLGQIRPLRLLPKANVYWEGKSLRSTVPNAVVKSITPVGVQKTIGLKTSTGTLVAEGMLSHNSYWFRAVMGGAFSNLDLLVADEAHLLLSGDNPIASAMEVQLYRPTLRFLGLDLPDYKETDYGSWRSWARRTLDILGGESSAFPRRFEDMSRSDVRRASAIKGLSEKCGRLIDLDDDWLVRRDAVGVTFGPVWVRDYAEQYLFQHAKKTVLLSATILSAEHFIDGLGIAPDQVDFFQLPSTFDAGRRPLRLRPVAKVDKKMGDADAAALVAAVDAILDRHPTEKGLVHTANYDLARLVRGGSRNLDRLIWHESGNRAAKVEEFRKSDKPLVMLSPSLHTGLDLPGEQLRFQIVLKVPYPNLGDERIRKRMKLGPDGNPNPRGQAWYSWQTLCTLIQAYGRVMRSEDDWGVTYVLDEHAKRLFGMTKKLIPKWVTDAVIWEVPTERFKEEIDGELEAG